MGLIVFAPGVFLAIIDAFLWAGLTALAIAVMRRSAAPLGMMHSRAAR